EVTGALVPGTLTVSRSGSSTALPLTVQYTVGGTATAGTDYTALSGSVTIAAGQDSADISITPLADAVAEGSETVVLTLSSASGYTVASTTPATVTIADTPLPVITVAASRPNAGEPSDWLAARPGEFTLSRSGST